MQHLVTGSPGLAETWVFPDESWREYAAHSADGDDVSAPAAVGGPDLASAWAWLPKTHDEIAAYLAVVTAHVAERRV